MIWLVLLLLLAAILGVGTLLEAAFWTLAVIAVLVVLAFFLVSRAVRR